MPDKEQAWVAAKLVNALRNPNAKPLAAWRERKRLAARRFRANSLSKPRPLAEPMARDLSDEDIKVLMLGGEH